VNPLAAVWLGFGISVAAQNCNSLNVVSSIKNQDLKISAITGYQSDIIFLSDVRFNGREQAVCDKLKPWYNIIYNSTKNSRGVAILIRKQLEHEVLETIRDTQENIILLKININGNTIILGSVYGPNIDNNCGEFFEFLRRNLLNWSNIPCILGGDWNTTVSNLPIGSNPDVAFMRNIPSRIRSDHLLELCGDADLSDPYRTLHPDGVDFSYNPSGDLRKNRSRIDFSLVSPYIYQYIESCTVAQGYCRKTFDHKPIFLRLKKKKGKGRPCVFNGTINHELSDYVVKIAVHNSYLTAAMENAGLITGTIIDTECWKINAIEIKVNRIISLKGAAYSRDLTDLEEGELAILEADVLEDWLDTAPLDYIQTFERQVTADDFFEILLGNTRRAMLNFQNNLKAAESSAKRGWTSELLFLKASGYTANFDRICVLENKLNAASERYISDRLSNYIKSDVLCAEKMTPRFLHLAKENNSADLSMIKDLYGNPFPCPQERGEHITSFYETLYKNPATIPADFSNCVTNFLGDLVNHPAIRGCMLNEEESSRLDLALTIDELDEAVEHVNLKSAPGIDGLNNKFIKKFWKYFRVPLFENITECIGKRELTRTFRTALIRLIPKKGDISMIKNWRPISLLTCFYKIVSKAVNTRLDTVIDKVTSLDQKAYNKNRYIQEALISTIDTIRHCENNGIKGAILSIDQKKAFDSVYHGYMREVYKFFGFGEIFVNLLETIGNGRTARIILENDKQSREFDLERGFAQGNGPSPKKYNIGEQILLFRLAYDPLIYGVYTTFLVPRSIINEVVTYPRVEEAERKGWEGPVCGSGIATHQQESSGICRRHKWRL
jgi:exonuclease III